MGKLLRGKVMAELSAAYAKNVFANFDGFHDPQAFAALMARIAKRSWNVYAKAPFGKSQYVLSYLARYTHRAGIANSRLRDVSDQRIVFRTKVYGVATLA